MINKKKSLAAGIIRAPHRLKTPQFLVEDLVTGLVHGPFPNFTGANHQRLMIQTWFPELQLIVKPILESSRFGACQLICQSEWWLERFKKPQISHFSK